MRTRLHPRHVFCWIFPRLCHTAQNGREGNSFVLRSSPSFSGSRKLITRMCLRSLKSYVFITRCKFGLQEFMEMHVKESGDRGHAINGDIDFSMFNFADIGAIRLDETRHIGQRQTERVSAGSHIFPEYGSLRGFQQAAIDGRQFTSSLFGALYRHLCRLLQLAHAHPILMPDTCCSQRFSRCAHMTRLTSCGSKRWENLSHRIGRFLETQAYRAMTLLYSSTAAIIAGARISPRESQAMSYFDTGGMTAKHT